MPVSQSIGPIVFAENPEPRCPCVLLLDTSGSMTGRPIHELNKGVHAFCQEVMKDPVADRRVDVAVITFDTTVRLVADFANVSRLAVPTLIANGFTHMGEGINKALDLLQQRKALYRQNGIAYYRPWVLMITDGEPQEEAPQIIEAATRRLRDEEATNKVAFFAVGVQDANMTRLEQIVTRAPVKLRGLEFNEMFVWLSSSMQMVVSAGVSQDDPRLAAVPAALGGQRPLGRPGEG